MKRRSHEELIDTLKIKYLSKFTFSRNIKYRYKEVSSFDGFNSDGVALKNGKDKIVLINIPLVHHPNPDKDGQFYVVPRNYADDKDSFDGKVYDWNWDRNDKRKIKRIKKNNHIKR